MPITLSTRWALAGLSLSMLLSSLATSIANIALPTLVRELGVSFQAAQWVILAYLLAITISIVTVGRLGDLFGRRRLLLAGVFVFTAASAASGLAPALWLVVAARAVQGLGAAVMMALTVASVGELLPKAKTGSAMGLVGTTSAIGTALGPSLGGVLLAHVGWRAVFLVNIPLGVVALVLLHRHLPADRPAPTTSRARFDVLGTVSLALTLGAYALAMTIGRGRVGALDLALLSAAALGAGLFILAERRAAAPLLPLTMFRDPHLSASLATSLLVATVLMATLIVGPFYLSLALRLDDELVGLVMSAGPIVAALTGVPAGRIVDRFGAQPATMAALAGIAGGALALSVAPTTLGVPGYVVPIVVVTAGYALFQTANNTAVMKDVSPGQRGVISGTLSLSRNLGLLTGASVMGGVFALASGADDITAASPEAVATGMRVTFGVAAALIVVAITVVVGGRAIARARVHLFAAILVIAVVPGVAAAQDSGDRAFVLRSADGASSVRLLGLVQLQYAHDWPADGAETDALVVHRARVGLVGSALTRDLRYMLVVDLAGADVRLLFLHVEYTLVPDWLTVRVGQFKRPFSRSFLTMASQLSMIDRPSTVGPSAFGDSVDVGVMVHNGSSEPFEYAIGVFRGSGAGDLPERIDPLVAVRVGYNSDGLDGYSEGDLEGGALRFGIAAAALVDFDADGDHESFSSGVGDILLMAHGLSLSSAFYVGARQDGPRWEDQRLSAIGHSTQVGYVIGGWVEPVVRYGLSMPAGAGDDQHDVDGGLNVYFRGHALKLQTFVGARFHEGRGAPDTRFQAQLTLAL